MKPRRLWRSFEAWQPRFQRGVDTGADPELIKVAIQEFLAKLDAIDRETIRAAMPEQEP